MSPSQQRILLEVLPGNPGAASETSLLTIEQATAVGQGEHQVAEEGTAPPPWSSLPAELVATVVGVAGCDPLTARAVSQVCASWRHALERDHALLSQLRIRKLRLWPPADVSSPLPRLVELAIQSGNLGAALAAARHLDAASCRLARALAQHTAQRAAKCWAKAAKLGHPEAAWRMGFSAYKGMLGQPRDSEQALFWLSKACRLLLEACPGLAQQRQQQAAQAHETALGHQQQAAQLPLMLTEADCRALLAQAAHVLAWLHMDGEACKQDTAAAIRHFKLAAACGCEQAQITLGSLLKSGQYA